MTSTALVTAVFGKLGAKAVERLSEMLEVPINDVRARLTAAFEDHLLFALSKCETVKTIVSDERPVRLDSIYVGLDLLDGHIRIKDDDLLSNRQKYKRAIIKGTAGAGKTMLMKHLVLKTFIDSDKIPIFIDLRDIEDPRKESFLKSIFNLCTPEEKKDTYKVFLAGLRTGVFSFFFDGLDEVNPEYREQTFRQIQRFPSTIQRSK